MGYLSRPKPLEMSVEDSALMSHRKEEWTDTVISEDLFEEGGVEKLGGWVGVIFCVKGFQPEIWMGGCVSAIGHMVNVFVA